MSMNTTRLTWDGYITAFHNGDVDNYIAAFRDNLDAKRSNPIPEDMRMNSIITWHGEQIDLNDPRGREAYMRKSRPSYSPEPEIPPHMAHLPENNSKIENLDKNLRFAWKVITCPIWISGAILFNISTTANMQLKHTSRYFEKHQNTSAQIECNKLNAIDGFNSELSHHPLKSSASKIAQVLLCTGPHIAIPREALAAVSLIGLGCAKFGLLKEIDCKLATKDISKSTHDITRIYLNKTHRSRIISFFENETDSIDSTHVIWHGHTYHRKKESFDLSSLAIDSARAKAIKVKSKTDIVFSDTFIGKLLDN